MRATAFELFDHHKHSAVYDTPLERGSRQPTIVLNRAEEFAFSMGEETTIMPLWISRFPLEPGAGEELFVNMDAILGLEGVSVLYGVEVRDLLNAA